jgi:hypothetical protein
LLLRLCSISWKSSVVISPVVDIRIAWAIAIWILGFLFLFLWKMTLGFGELHWISRLHLVVWPFQ